MVAFLKLKSNFFKRWTLLSTKFGSWLFSSMSKAFFGFEKGKHVFPFVFKSTQRCKKVWKGHHERSWVELEFKFSFVVSKVKSCRNILLFLQNLTEFFTQNQLKHSKGVQLRGKNKIFIVIFVKLCVISSSCRSKSHDAI